MKRYRLVTSGGGVQHVLADGLKQVGDYVTFYTDKEASGVVRLGGGDGVYFDKEMVESPKACPDCGQKPGERGKPLEDALPIGTFVTITGQGEAMYTVRASAVVEGRLFYRLHGRPAGVFLRESLTVMENTEKQQG